MTKQRAISALMNSRPQSDSRSGVQYFAQVWVVGKEICFTEAAAYRWQHYLRAWHPGEYFPIEKVTIQEAFNERGVDYEKNKTLVDNCLMRGEVFIGGNLFNPIKPFFK